MIRPVLIETNRLVSRRRAHAQAVLAVLVDAFILRELARRCHALPGGQWTVMLAPMPRSRSQAASGGR
jgi:hypothetical protein